MYCERLSSIIFLSTPSEAVTSIDGLTIAGRDVANCVNYLWGANRLPVRSDYKTIINYEGHPAEDLIDGE
jgi:hypothetical protein